MDARTFTAASVGSHTIEISCHPVMLSYEAVCRCGWCLKGKISGRADHSVMSSVLEHWRGIDQEWGAGDV
jgi:hypothetical protein